MKKLFIGRDKEQKLLQEYLNSSQSEFITVYGRRRVGKTFLIQQVIGDDYAFYVAGMHNVTMRIQLDNFIAALKKKDSKVRKAKTWLDAFMTLENYLESLPEGRKIVFIDEMPWMDTPKSGFITAFESFWNGWASAQPQILLVVCGSSSSWIMDNLINSPGGLYDRVDTEIQLQPFTLKETEQMLEMKGVEMSRYDIMEVYMAVGGIPYYLNQLKPGLSASEQIDHMFFARNAKLGNEYERLFNSTFANPEQIESIVRFLSGRHGGYSRDDISKKINVQGKTLTQLLRSMCVSNLIEKYQPFGCNARQLQYRLVDHFLAQASGR